MKLDPTLADSLGLGDSPELATTKAPASSAAHGLQRGGALVDLDTLLGEDAPFDPGWRPVAGLPEGLAMEHATSAPGLFLLESSQPMAAVGKHTFLDGALALDGRDGQSAAIRFDDDALTLVVVEGDEVATAAVETSAVLRIPEPPVRGWLHPGLPAWLARHVVEHAQSPSTLQRAQAIGALVRLWTVPTATPDLDVLLAAPDPTSRAKAWYQTLGRWFHSDVLEHALDEAAALRETLDDFPERLGDQDATTNRRMALSWLHRRDDLASLATLTHVCKLEAGPLRPALARLDAEGRGHLTVWSLIDLRGDPHLDTVAWQEPDAWWGQLS